MSRVIALFLVVVLVAGLLVVRRHAHHQVADPAPRPVAAVGHPLAAWLTAARVRAVTARLGDDDDFPGRQRGHRPHIPSLWRRLAGCEAGGDWRANTGNGYFGGLQFLARTWWSFKGTQFAPRADLASRREQVTVARRVLRRQGWAAWPACSRELGLR